MAWVFLVIAGVFEIAWTVGLKFTHGFTRLWPSVLVGLALTASMLFLAQAVRTLPIGTGYAVWTGIGVVGTAVFGIVLFSESAALGRLVSIGLIVVGIIGLRLTEM